MSGAPVAEFVCVDCASRVIIRFIRFETDHRCASCHWIREHVPAAYQKDARERLGVPLAGDAAP